MKVQQKLEVSGSDLVLVLYSMAGKELCRRTWEGAAKYLRPEAQKGMACLCVPKEAALEIK